MNCEYIRTNEIKYSYLNNGYLVPDITIYIEYMPSMHRIHNEYASYYIRQVYLLKYEHQIYLYGRNKTFLFKY